MEVFFYTFNQIVMGYRCLVCIHIIIVFFKISFVTHQLPTGTEKRDFLNITKDYIKLQGACAIYP